jgi:hypothetical protein
MPTGAEESTVSDTEADEMEEHLRDPRLPRVAQRPVERLAPGYRKRTGAGGGGAERSMVGALNADALQQLVVDLFGVAA